VIVARRARADDRGSVRWLILVLVACTHAPRLEDQPGPPPPDAGLQPLDLDIIVGHADVSLFPATSCGNSKLPQPGQSTTWGDAGCTSCIERVSVGEVSWSATYANGIGAIDLKVDVTDDAVLDIEGCGGSAHIPIGGLPMPVPSANARWVEPVPDVTVAWSGGQHGRTAVLWFSFGLWIDIEHVAVDEFTFVAPDGAMPEPFVRVDVLGSMLPIATDFGIVRLWPGETTFAQLPTAQ
jgi:hypothetical protein